MIQINNISKKYGDHYAVKDLSFEFEKGNIYGFLGPNGAGKSTTMNIMTGYIAASEGNVLIEGFDIVKDSTKAKACIGYLPELPPLYQDMTVLEYLDFVADLKKVPKKEKDDQIKTVMDKTFITDMSKRLIKNLSKGYKQRVGLAQAMLGKPDVIILDEPTVGLDPKQIIEIRELIRELKKDHTVILSSHILSEISEVCDKLLIIAKGRLVASGTSEELLNELGGNTKIELIVKGNAENVDKLLSSIKEIESKEIVAIDEDKCECIINVTKDADISEELFDKLSNEHMTIYKLLPIKKSLEDIFLEVTDEDYVAKLAEPGEDSEIVNPEPNETDLSGEEEE